MSPIARVFSCGLPLTFVGSLGLCVALLGISHASADVINLPPDSCILVDEVGEVELLTEYPLRKGADCEERVPRATALLTVVAEWSPRDLPVMVQVLRDRRGYRIYLLSMLRDRNGRSSCWTERSIARPASRSADQMWSQLDRAFSSWAQTCTTVGTLGAEGVQLAFRAQRQSFGRALSSMTAVRNRFAPREDYHVIGQGSFLPIHISQNLLNAVADACAGPRERLRLLPNGAIAWSFDGRQPYGADGSLPFDSCVNDQIRYFPGYPKRN